MVEKILREYDDVYSILYYNGHYYFTCNDDETLYDADNGSIVGSVYKEDIAKIVGTAIIVYQEDEEEF